MSKMNETFSYRRETFNDRPTCFKWSQFVFLANPLPRPDPQSQPSLTLNLQALIFYHLQALISILCPVFWRPGFETCEGTVFLATDVPAWLACTELSELLMTV